MAGCGEGVAPPTGVRFGDPREVFLDLQVKIQIVCILWRKTILLARNLTPWGGAEDVKHRG